MKRTVAITCALALFATPIARAQQSSDLRKLFPREADISIDPGRSKLVQLELPTEIMSSVKPDLSDLRILDLNGNEVAFLVDRGAAPPSTPRLKQTVAAKIILADHSQKAPQQGPPVVKEVYELEIPKVPPEAGQWDLALETDRAHFVRRVDVELLTSQQWERVLDRGAFFRLPRADGEQLRVPLLNTQGSRLRVTLTGEDQNYLEPKFVFESTRKFAERTQVSLPLAETRRERRDGKTILELARPPGIVPSVLQMVTPTPAFDRNVEVRDLGPGARDVVIGSAALFRVDTNAPVENRELKLTPAFGDRLRVEISDGDSPPLAGLRFIAIVRQPRLIFALPTVEDAPAGTLLFGGGRAHLPRYDLAGLLPPEGDTALDKRAQAAASLYSLDSLRRGHIGGIRSNPAFDTAPALGFVMQPGADVDVRLYSLQRLLTVEQSQDGLARVRIDAADLANLRADLADMRIVDSESRQWPYLVEHAAVKEWLDVRAQKPDRRNRTSQYKLDLPVNPLGFDRLSIVAADSYFDRAYRLVGTDLDGNELTLAQGRLTHGGNEAQQPVVEVNTLPTRVKDAKLIVEDGENAPLGLRGVQVRVALPVVYLAAPAGYYTLLLGNPEDKAPVYDISRVRDLVLAVSSVPTKTGPLSPNPSFRRRARLASGQGPEHALLWVAIGVAVLALGAFTLRLARREGEQGST